MSSSTVLLSVLILAIPSRRESSNVVSSLLEQVRGRRDVEILCLLDNKMRTIGEKRQNLLELAKGEFVVFVDDDDQVASNYIEEIVQAISPSVDLIVFDLQCTIDHTHVITQHYGKEFESTSSSFDSVYSLPTCIMAWRREIARKTSFEHINTNEDYYWGEQSVVHVRPNGQVKVGGDQPLYFYAVDSHSSESGIRAEN